MHDTVPSEPQPLTPAILGMQRRSVTSRTFLAMWGRHRRNTTQRYTIQHSGIRETYSCGVHLCPFFSAPFPGCFGSPVPARDPVDTPSSYAWAILKFARRMSHVTPTLLDVVSEKTYRLARGREVCSDGSSLRSLVNRQLIYCTTAAAVQCLRCPFQNTTSLGGDVLWMSTLLNTCTHSRCTSLFIIVRPLQYPLQKIKSFPLRLPSL